ncbi:MAG: chemotaxis protein CheW [Lysobacter sp.]|nr:MAG: chemotaxis protein CheW [Lysobacter sp.]
MNANASSTSSAHASVDEVRGVLIQIVGGQVLLPNASTVEVLSYAEPDPVENAPNWMLGRIRWRGWRVPMIAYSRMVGVGSESSTIGTKVVMLKALGGDPKLPYFALLAQGFPRLVTIGRDSLIVDTAEDETLPESVRTRVMFNDAPALVPDLDAIERMISDALRPVETPAEVVSDE